MANGVLMPKAGITVESCIIGEWLKQVGDHVNVGDILFTYETDKASFECESTAEGELLEIFYGAGDEVPCLINVCAIGTKGEDCSALKGAGAETAAPAAEAAPAAAGPKNVVAAPLPGRVLAVKVKVGDKVVAGQEVVVLEAMKMENSISSDYAGTVVEVLVAEGDNVQSDAALISIQ